MQKVNFDDGGLTYATKFVRNLDFFRNVGLKSEFLLLEREGKKCLCRNLKIKTNFSTSTNMPQVFLQSKSSEFTLVVFCKQKKSRN